jgi:hypothetical protein
MPINSFLPIIKINDSDRLDFKIMPDLRESDSVLKYSEILA